MAEQSVSQWEKTLHNLRPPLMAQTLLIYS